MLLNNLHLVSFLVTNASLWYFDGPTLVHTSLSPIVELGSVFSDVIRRAMALMGTKWYIRFIASIDVK